MSEKENCLVCHCSKCESGDKESRKKHYHEVKDYHPEIPWSDSSKIKRNILKQLEKTWGKETAKKKFEKGDY